MKKILLTLFLGFTLGLQAQETVQLRFNYNPGDVYLMKVNTVSAMEQSMFTNIVVEMQMEILGKENENFLTESRFTKISMDMMQGGVTMSYDSAKSEEELDASGKMIKAQMAPMLQAVINNTVNPLGENVKTTIVPQEAANAGNFANQNGMVYPEKALQLGDEWTDTKSNNGMTMNTTYTVNEITENSISLKVSGNTTGMSEGKISGYVTIDRASGVPEESKIVVELTVMGKPLKTEATVQMEKQ